MPGRSYGRRRMNFGARPIVNSIKNIIDDTGATVGGTNTNTALAIAKDAIDPGANPTDVKQGCQIRAIHLNVEVNGTAAAGVNNAWRAYIIKNPGTNLTNPNPGTTGTSNEKKFIIQEFMFNLNRAQDGGTTRSFSRWLKIPKRYWRMGIDDRWTFVQRTETSTTANYCIKAIYKYYF